MTDANEPIPDLQELVRAITVGDEPLFYVRVADAKRLLKRLADVTVEAERLRATVTTLTPSGSSQTESPKPSSRIAQSDHHRARLIDALVLTTDTSHSK